jgi:hypothetical protein
MKRFIDNVAFIEKRSVPVEKMMLLAEATRWAPSQGTAA